MTPAEERRDDRRAQRDDQRREGRDRGRRGGAPGEGAAGGGNLASRHVRFGWWMLLAFLTLGIVLESLLAWRSQTYLEVGNETRRLLWRLAHAHGTLLSLVNIAFGLTAAVLHLAHPRLRHVASPCLMLATVILPLGFFLGGVFPYGNDPGLGTLVLAPLGALLLFVAVLLIALSVSKK